MWTKFLNKIRHLFKRVKKHAHVEYYYNQHGQLRSKIKK